MLNEPRSNVNQLYMQKCALDLQEKPRVTVEEMLNMNTKMAEQAVNENDVMLALMQHDDAAEAYRDTIQKTATDASMVLMLAHMGFVTEG